MQLSFHEKNTYGLIVADFLSTDNINWNKSTKQASERSASWPSILLNYRFRGRFIEHFEEKSTTSDCFNMSKGNEKWKLLFRNSGGQNKDSLDA